MDGRMPRIACYRRSSLVALESSTQRFLTPLSRLPPNCGRTFWATLLSSLPKMDLWKTNTLWTSTKHASTSHSVHSEFPESTLSSRGLTEQRLCPIQTIQIAPLTMKCWNAFRSENEQSETQSN